MDEFLCNIKEEKFLLAKLLYFKNPKAIKENIDKIGNIEIDFYFYKNHHMENKTTNDGKNICKFCYSGLINVVNKKLVKVMKRKQQPYIKNGQVI